ncbi:phage/plasmid replication domain-containing protein [Brevibacillus migulae]|uniref:phage/plasmid replication domain-containing protein n=1 Tax=Brevibacillus migulae TaxID=1644114 RepID=UPI00143161C4|nr:phage/plasmid replication protein [Brevibacillus migulae]
MKSLVDTVKFDLRILLSKKEIGRIPWSKIEKRPQSKMTYYRLFDSKDASIPRITYAESSKSGEAWLKVEVSMPRFLYGSNVYEVTSADIKRFFKELRRCVADRLQIPLSKVPLIEQSEMEKLHLCKNFKVGKLLPDYLRVLSEVELHGHKMVPHYYSGRRRFEGVEWRKGAKGKRAMKVYDKHEEIRQNKTYHDKQQLLADSQGVLRFEYELTSYEMKKLSPSRIAGELLNPRLIAQMLRKNLSKLGVDKSTKASAFDNMINCINQQSWDTRKKNSLIAFITQLYIEGEGHCRKKYSRSAYHANYNALKKLFKVNKIVFSDIDLPALKIEKRSVDKKRLSPSFAEKDLTA